MPFTDTFKTMDAARFAAFNVPQRYANNGNMKLKVICNSMCFMIFHHNVKVPQNALDRNDLQHVQMLEPFTQSLVSFHNTAVTHHLHREQL